MRPFFFLILEDFKGCHLKNWCPENEDPHLKNDHFFFGVLGGVQHDFLGSF